MRNLDLHTEIGGAAPGGQAGPMIQLAPHVVTRGFVMVFGRNEEIFGQGEPADFVYKVAAGVVRTSRVLSDGRRQIAAFHFAGEVFGLEGGAEHELCAEAVTDCEIGLVKRPALERAADLDSAMARDLWALTVRDLKALRAHMLVLGRKGATERVAAFLLQMANRNGASRVALPMSRTDIADYLGLTIESVSRSFTQLEREGAIALPSARDVELRDRARLEHYEG
jgi:CRP/FNR family nitrogen fixation transcriptional regulator